MKFTCLQSQALQCSSVHEIQGTIQLTWNLILIEAPRLNSSIHFILKGFSKKTILGGDATV